MLNHRGSITVPSTSASMQVPLRPWEPVPDHAGAEDSAGGAIAGSDPPLEGVAWLQAGDVDELRLRARPDVHTCWEAGPGDTALVAPATASTRRAWIERRTVRRAECGAEDVYVVYGWPCGARNRRKLWRIARQAHRWAWNPNQLWSRVLSFPEWASR